MKLGREVSRHNELDNWRNTHRFESVMATKWLLLTISETEPGLWDRLLAEIFDPRSQMVAISFDFVRLWDNTPSDEPYPEAPDYTKRDVFLGGCLNWSHTETWAWDGMQKSLAELQRRREPIPEALRIWAYAVATGILPRPGSGPGRKRESERNTLIVAVHDWLRKSGYSWEKATHEIPDRTYLSFDAVKKAMRAHKRNRPVRVKKTDLKVSLMRKSNARYPKG